VTQSQNIWDDLWGDSDKVEIAPKSSFNSIKLAQYFQEKFMAAEWQHGFGIVNLRALAAALAKWKTTTDSDTVMAMIDRYMSDPDMRGTNPGWPDFLYHAEKIANDRKPTNKSVMTEEDWERLYG